MKITGDTPKVRRFISGMFSFDRAFENARGEIGFPLGQVTEIAGPTFCGKSTTTYGLCGLIAKEHNTNIALADFEGFDPEFVSDVLTNSGFDGSLNVVQKGEDEKTLDALIDVMKEKEYKVGMLDSVGAISPLSELDGELGAANMGRRAKLMAQFSRKMTHLILSEPTPKIMTMFLINHIHPNLGGMGMITPGGETIRYLSAVRIRMKRKDEFKDQSYWIEGKVVKNRFGYKDRAFYLVVLSGKGIHPGLTAMFDCFLLGLATRGAIVKIGGESVGRLKSFFDNAHEGNNTVFEPFIELLKTNGTKLTSEPDDSQTEVEDTED